MELELGNIVVVVVELLLSRMLGLLNLLLLLLLLLLRFRNQGLQGFILYRVKPVFELEIKAKQLAAILILILTLHLIKLYWSIVRNCDTKLIVLNLLKDILISCINNTCFNHRHRFGYGSPKSELTATQVLHYLKVIILILTLLNINTQVVTLNSGSVFGCMHRKLSDNLEWDYPLLAGGAHLKTVIVDACYYDKFFVDLKLVCPTPSGGAHSNFVIKDTRCYKIFVVDLEWDCSLFVGNAGFKNVTINVCRLCCKRLFVDLKLNYPLHTGGAYFDIAPFSVSKQLYVNKVVLGKLCCCC